MMVEGKLQVEGEVIHVIVEKCFDLSSMLRKLSVGNLENVFSDGRNFR
jgi:error-prone DNA polymerase